MVVRNWKKVSSSTWEREYDYEPYGRGRVYVMTPGERGQLPGEYAWELIFDSPPDVQNYSGWTSSLSAAKRAVDRLYGELI